MNRFKSGDKVRVISDIHRHAKNRKARIYTEMLGKIFTIIKYDQLSDTYSLKESIHNCVDWRLEPVNSEINYIDDPEYESMII